MTNSSAFSQRNTSYRAMIPFYILFDERLTANHLRLYGQIEQMENNPLVQPTFSNQWCAIQLGIKIRQFQYLSEDLKRYGYIERIQIATNKWLWRTKKIQIIEESCSQSYPQNEECGSLTVHGGGAAAVHGGGALGVHTKIPKDKIPKDTNEISEISEDLPVDNFSQEPELTSEPVLAPTEPPISVSEPPPDEIQDKRKYFDRALKDRRDSYVIKLGIDNQLYQHALKLLETNKAQNWKHAVAMTMSIAPRFNTKASDHSKTAVEASDTEISPIPVPLPNDIKNLVCARVSPNLADKAIDFIEELIQGGCSLSINQLIEEAKSALMAGL